MKTKSIIKIRYILLTLLTVCIMGAFVVKDNAAISVYVKEVTEARTIEYENGVVFKAQGMGVAKHTDPNFFNETDVYSITAPGENTAVRLVAWGMQTTNGWGAGTVQQIAQDYQNRNPGMTVVGAITGDFFHNQTDITQVPEYLRGSWEANTKEPLDTWIGDGNVYKKDFLSTSPVHDVLGINEDRTYITNTMPNVGAPVATDLMQLKIYNGDNPIQYGELEKINALPTTGTAIFNPRFTGSVDFTGYTVYVGSYENFRYSVDGLHGGVYVDGDNLGSYLKGTITKIIDGANIGTITEVKKGTFYLVSKDANLSSSLKVDNKVLCQYDMTGAWENCNNAMGYIFEILTNGSTEAAKANYAGHEYASGDKQRAVIGFKADNSVVIMVAGAGNMTGSRRAGPSVTEMGELLKNEGCVQGYNLDGGGSVDLTYLNENGNLQTDSVPADGSGTSHRIIGNAWLIVMPKSGIEIAQVTDTTVKFTKEQLAPGTVSDVTFAFAGKTFTMENDTITIDGLRKNTSYTINCTYTYTDNGHTYKGAKDFTVKTSAYRIPVPEVSVLEVNETTANISYKITDRDEVLKQGYIQYGEKFIEITGERGTVTLENLTPDTEYSVKVIVEYEKDDSSGEIESDAVTFRTKEAAPVEKTCEEDPTQEKCKTDPVEKTCEEDPTQEKCKTDPVEKTCEEDPTQEKCAETKPEKGCKKKSAVYVAVMITTMSALAMVFRKRR